MPSTEPLTWPPPSSGGWTTISPPQSIEGATGPWLAFPGHPATGLGANAHIDSQGFFYRSTSASKYKLDIKTEDVSDDLLDLPVKTWIDKGSTERAENLSRQMGPLTESDTMDLSSAEGMRSRRIFGVIAEDVEAIDPRLATYDTDGEVDGVAYDRIGPALIPIVRRQRDRIAALEKQVEALTSRLDAAGL